MTKNGKNWKIGLKMPVLRGYGEKIVQN